MPQMIFNVQGQTLKITAVPPHLVGGTVNYLSALFSFDTVWDSLIKVANFSCKTDVREAQIENNAIQASASSILNLNSGQWKISVVGYTANDDGTLTKRITTHPVYIRVMEPGTSGGAAGTTISASLGETILSKVTTAISNLASHIVDTTAHATLFAQKLYSAATAPAYTETTYAVGTYCTHNGLLYVCNTTISTAESWNASHWDATTIYDEFSTIYNNEDDMWGAIHDVAQNLTDHGSDASAHATQFAATQPKITASGLLKGDGDGGVTAAEAGTDYQAPLPDMAENNGKVLSISEGTLAWVSQVTGLPDMTDHAGQLLTTDGSVASWGNTVTANAANQLPLVVKGVSGQSVNFQEWRSSTNAVYGGLGVGGMYCTGGFFTGVGLFGEAKINSFVNTLSTGTIISRNIADANPALIINLINAASTGKILDLQFGGVSKASFDLSGCLIANSSVITASAVDKVPLILQGITGQTADLFQVKNATNLVFSIDKNGSIAITNLGSKTGIGVYWFGNYNYGQHGFDSTNGYPTIKRDYADAFPALAVNQANAASTGNIAEFRFGGVTKSYVTNGGSVYAPYFMAPSGQAYGQINMGGSVAPTTIARNVADAVPAFMVNQSNAGSTGSIIELQSGGVTKASVSTLGRFWTAGDRFYIAAPSTPASASASGSTGAIAWDTNYIYVCTDTNTWKRAALTTW